LLDLNPCDLIKFINTGEACFLVKRFDAYDTAKGSLGMIPGIENKTATPIWCWEVKWNNVVGMWSRNLNCTKKTYVLEDALIIQLTGKYKKEKSIISVYNHLARDTI